MITYLLQKMGVITYPEPIDRFTTKIKRIRSAVLHRCLSLQRGLHEPQGSDQSFIFA